MDWGLGIIGHQWNMRPTSGLAVIGLMAWDPTLNWRVLNPLPAWDEALVSLSRPDPVLFSLYRKAQVVLGNVVGADRVI